jgi:hypothetical protein
MNQRGISLTAIGLSQTQTAEGLMHVPSCDIFSGFFDKDAIWLETVEGLAAASERMKEFAARRPGPYFVFDCQNHNILDSIDTTRQPLSRRPKSRLQKQPTKIDEVA